MAFGNKYNGRTYLDICIEKLENRTITNEELDDFIIYLKQLSNGEDVY